MAIRDIPIDECVHFRGFRYGGFNNNIYEDYIAGLASGVDLRQLRLTFAKRILAFKGVDFSSVLNIRLMRKYPPWVYPWTLNSARKHNFTYYQSASNPDIVCHYSTEGVLASHINREFYWLERAYNAMTTGYKPESFGYVTVHCMKRGGQTRYLVVDGNHRLAAMHSLGGKMVRVDVRYPMLCNIGASWIWPGVISKRYIYEDAVAIFDRYFVNENLVLPEAGNLDVIQDEVLLV